MKETIGKVVDQIGPELWELSDQIFDQPELQNQEYISSRRLLDYLLTQGFQGKMGICGLETAFRAEFSSGEGGPRFGLLCEYDALADMGHGCAHHMQGPTILGAALALKAFAGLHNFSVVVYGTPAEEGGRGKRVMIEEGAFRDIDLALAVHGSDFTTPYSISRAVHRYDIHFSGTQAHAASAPERGRSAVDALQLANIAVEFMREHVAEDARIHYAMYDLPNNPNIVPHMASGQYLLRSYDNSVVEEMGKRLQRIAEGAALMTDTQYEIVDGNGLKSTRENTTLSDVIYRNLQELQAPQMTRSPQSAGSTDFGDVTQLIPGVLTYLSFVPPGTSAHSQGFLDAGKSEAIHSAISLGAKALAGTCLDLLEHPEWMENIQKEFKERESLNKVKH